ncbi:MAG: sugar transferase [Lachnospiraceae bacterium]|nr:sugar transferase [Lachnospiraceae bacterium]
MYNRGLKGWIKHLDFILLDLIIIEFSFVLAYGIRHQGQSVFNNEEYRSIFFVLALAVPMASVFLRLHSGILRRGYLREITAVIKLVLFTATVILAYMFFGKISEKYSRLVVMYFIILSSVFVYIAHVIWKMTLIRVGRSNDTRIRHMFLITTGDIAENIIDTIRNNSSGLTDLTGMALADSKDRLGEEINGVAVKASMEDVTEYISGQWVDEVMVCLPPEYDMPRDILRECYLMGITTHVALKLDADRHSAREAGVVAGIYTLTESVRIVDGYEVVIKRIVDILGSIIGLMITVLLTLIIAPAIFISDPGPVFFSQKRVGKNGRIFKMYKFRSMYRNAEEMKERLMAENEMQGLMFKVDQDPRIIGSGPDGKKRGIGWFIRRSSIDEFPQFLNVFLGDMSLVGTRPPTVDEWEKYEKRHRARLAMKPGITGLWQAYGRGEIKNFDDVVDMDMEYINTWSIGGDIKILLRTVVVVLTGRGAK